MSDTDTNTIPSARIISPEAQTAKERADSYAEMTIGDALLLVESRRGESRKEKKRLLALLDQLDVTKRTTVKEARQRAARK